MTTNRPLMLVVNLVLFFCLSIKTQVVSGQDSETSAQGEETRKILDTEVIESVEYPELQVQPSASQRLRIEAINERVSRWHMHWPIQLSSLSLLLAATKADGNYPYPDNERSVGQLDDSVLLAQAVSGGWLAGTVLLSTLYKPYETGREKTSFRPKNKRMALMKERLAEEYLQGPADLGWKLSLLSTGTHLGASLFLASSTTTEDRPYAIAAAALSLTPMLFRYRWLDVWSWHQTYKKRVYGSLSNLSGGFVPVAGGARMAPGAHWQLSF